VGEAFLIMLREGFEAALVVAIVLAYLRAVDRRDLGRSAWYGVGAGVVVALAIGLGVRATVGALEGEARMLAFAAISASAAAVLTWMIFWMRKQGAATRTGLHAQVDRALASARGGRGVLLVAFAAVLREGVEAALFLLAATLDANSNAVLVGGVAGLAVAVLIGVALYAGGRRVSVQVFFRVTGVLLILFAAGLCAKTVFFLQAAGDLGSLDDAAYNLTAQHWLTVGSESGRVLAGLFGWDPRPSVEQVVVWLAYLVPVGALFLAGERRTPDRRPAVARQG
jgi:high-affinity iron transporter